MVCSILPVATFFPLTESVPVPPAPGLPPSVQEETIASSNLDWTIVRPGILTNGPATGRYHALIDAESWRGGFISRRDVADFLVRQIADRSCIGKAPVLVR